ncbi:MAG: rod shape-determining protein MreD [Bacteroidales bacterium]|jgi:rod shape-determining protein MreD|nr:rod shape-determining protein MreD [Bacteroidales bacterium]
MIREVAVNIFRFALLVFLQFFVLNNIQFSGFVNPYLYVMFLLLLPFRTTEWFMLVLAFVLGLVIDVTSATIGYHTVATIFMAYFRYHLLRFIAPHDGYEPGMSPTISSLGFSWFLRYTSILVLAHHLVLFWIESFRFGDLLPATLRALASSVFTILLIFICQFLTMRPK